MKYTADMKTHYVDKFQIGEDGLDLKRESPFGGQGSCPVCGCTDIRVHFAGSEVPINYCPDCMTGVGAGEAEGRVVDMHLFSTAIEMKQLIMQQRRSVTV